MDNKNLKLPNVSMASISMKSPKISIFNKNMKYHSLLLNIRILGKYSKSEIDVIASRSKQIHIRSHKSIALDVLDLVYSEVGSGIVDIDIIFQNVTKELEDSALIGRLGDGCGYDS